jgi:hypothetical protein
MEDERKRDIYIKRERERERERDRRETGERLGIKIFSRLTN